MISQTAQSEFLPQAFAYKILKKLAKAGLVEILRENNEEWIDNLPITMEEPFEFIEGREDDVAELKENLGLQNWATLENVMDAMEEEYDIEGLTPEETRIIAGVRYEMVEKGYSIDEIRTDGEWCAVCASIREQRQKMETGG